MVLEYLIRNKYDLIVFGRVIRKYHGHQEMIRASIIVFITFAGRHVHLNRNHIPTRTDTFRPFVSLSRINKFAGLNFISSIS